LKQKTSLQVVKTLLRLIFILGNFFSKNCIAKRSTAFIM